MINPEIHRTARRHQNVLADWVPDDTQNNITYSIREMRAGVMKKIHKNSLIGQQGVNLIERIVLGMGFAWHPSGQVEAGIDGVIEIRDAATGTASNCIIQVQSKATTRPFTAETASTFEYLCESRDLDYWLAGNAPVILVVSRPDKNEAYWVSIKEYFADLHKRKTRRVVFDRVRNRFDESCQRSLVSLASPRDVGVYLAPPPKTERLYSNLLSVETYADRIFVAQTAYREPRDIWAMTRALKIEGGGEWLLRDKHLYSFHDLSLAPWATLCEPGTIENFATSEWANASDDGLLRDFVYLLNRCLTEKGRGLSISYHRKLGFYYFNATKDLSARVVWYQSMTNRTKRAVFQGYSSKTDASQIAYYRHSAFEGRFRRYDGSWYLEITPTYHFTRDGYNLDRYYEDKLKRIKIMERNQSVLGQVVMWAEYLSQPVNLFSAGYPFLQFGALNRLDIEAGLDDKSWLGEEEGDEASVLASPDNEGLWEEVEDV